MSGFIIDRPLNTLDIQAGNIPPVAAIVEKVSGKIPSPDEPPIIIQGSSENLTQKLEFQIYNGINDLETASEPYVGQMCDPSSEPRQLNYSDMMMIVFSQMYSILNEKYGTNYSISDMCNFSDGTYTQTYKPDEKVTNVEFNMAMSLLLGMDPFNPEFIQNSVTANTIEAIEMPELNLTGYALKLIAETDNSQKPTLGYYAGTILVEDANTDSIITFTDTKGIFRIHTTFIDPNTNKRVSIISYFGINSDPNAAKFSQALVVDNFSIIGGGPDIKFNSIDTYMSAITTDGRIYLPTSDTAVYVFDSDVSRLFIPQANSSIVTN